MNFAKKSLGQNFLKDQNINGNLITYEYFSGYVKNKSYLWDVIKGYKKVIAIIETFDLLTVNIVYMFNILSITYFF